MDRAAIAASFPRRSDVRVHGATLAACLAVVAAVNLSTPGLVDRAGQLKGTDFVHFYALGSLALRGKGEVLYDYPALARETVALVPESRTVSYFPIYGPQVALLFAPLAAFPYTTALVIWILLTILAYALCCAAIWRTCVALRAERTTVVLLAAAYPAFLNLLAYGQNSAIALACFTAAFLAMTQKQPFLAGLAIGTLIYKPQLGLVAAFVFVLSREWRVVAGAVVSALLQLAAAWAFFGAEVMAAYWDSVRRVGEISHLLGAKVFQMHSINAFLGLLLPWPRVVFALYLVSAAAVIAAALYVWRMSAPLSLRYSFLLLATVLASPHLNVYDLVVLAPALLMICDWTLAHRANPSSKQLQVMLYLVYALPLAGAAAQFTHIQLSVLATTVLAGMLLRVVTREPARQGSSFSNVSLANGQ